MECDLQQDTTSEMWIPFMNHDVNQTASWTITHVKISKLMKLLHKNSKYQRHQAWGLRKSMNVHKHYYLQWSCFVVSTTATLNWETPTTPWSLWELCKSLQCMPFSNPSLWEEKTRYKAWYHLIHDALLKLRWFFSTVITCGWDTQCSLFTSLEGKKNCPVRFSVGKN